LIWNATLLKLRSAPLVPTEMSETRVVASLFASVAHVAVEVASTETEPIAPAVLVNVLAAPNAVAASVSCASLTCAPSAVPAFVGCAPSYTWRKPLLRTSSAALRASAALAPLRC